MSQTASLQRVGFKEGFNKSPLVHKPFVAPNTTDWKLVPSCVDECTGTTWAIGIGHKDIVAAAICCGVVKNFQGGFFPDDIGFER